MYLCGMNTSHCCLGCLPGHYNDMAGRQSANCSMCMQAPNTHHHINASRNKACMKKQSLTTSALQDFARNQVGALADSVLAVEPGSDDADADADAVDGGTQQLHGGGLHMSDAGGALQTGCTGAASTRVRSPNACMPAALGTLQYGREAGSVQLAKLTTCHSVFRR
jgi:hypothetical protein